MARQNKGTGGQGKEGSWLFVKLRILFACILKPKEKGSAEENHQQNVIDSARSRRSSNNEHHRNEREQVVAASDVEPSHDITAISPNAPPPPESSTANLTREELSATYPNLRSFTFYDLSLSTRHFRREHFLGEGGFGKVYKGWLSDDDVMSPTRPGVGIAVAVKTLNRLGTQGDREWLAEVNYLSQLQHPNLVELVGFCCEGDKRMLVYEYVPRGNLESHLFMRSLPLPWSMRMRIMLDAAKGLAYLHHKDDSKKSVIFRDFKTSNVLLDKDYTAKLSDFGLAKDGPVGNRTHVSTRIMGTRGYAGPEYVATGHLTAKSDVYSYGMVLLEMITGKRAIDNQRPNRKTNLKDWAMPLIMKKGKACCPAVLDPNLGGHYSVKGALMAIQLATQCVSEDPSARPEMSEVVDVMKKIHYLVSDMPFRTPSPPPPPPSHATETGISANDVRANKYGLKTGSSTRNVPSRFQASPVSRRRKRPLPLPKPRPMA